MTPIKQLISLIFFLSTMLRLEDNPQQLKKQGEGG